MNNLRDDIPQAWQDALGEEVLDLLPSEKDLQSYQPHALFRALPPSPGDVRVVLLGMDPYPTPGVPEGLAFSVPEGKPLPQSLRNIFKELCSDTGADEPASGSLLPWKEEGVLLWNVALSVCPGHAGSHLQLWKPFSIALLRILQDRVFILLGRHALEIGEAAGASRVVYAPHPSPLSAWRGFHGSKIFTRANHLLEEAGEKPIDWKLT